MKNFSGKLMEDKLKIGWGTTDFLNYLDATEEEFWAYLKKNFSSKAFSHMQKRIKGHDRKKKRNKNHLLNNPSVTTTTELTVEDVCSSINSSTSTSSCIEHIDELKVRENELTKSICEKEATHNKLISQRNSLKIIFKTEKEKLLKLTQELKKSQDLVNSSYEKWLKITSDIENINYDINQERDLLAGIREELKASEIISIFAYENGEIEVDNSNSFTQEDENSSLEYFNYLIQNAIVENLTIKDIRQLSKLLALINLISQKGLSFEVTFESGLLQEVFEQI